MKKLITVLLFFLILTACAPVSLTSTPQSATPAELPSATAVPTNSQNTSGYPFSQNDAPTPAYPAPMVDLNSGPTNTPDPKLGRIEGILLLQGKPVTQTNLFLATIIKNEKATEVAAQVFRDTDPQTLTDANGHFVFVNVRPGRYTMMIEIPPNLYILYKPGKFEGLFIEVKAGETASFGTLNYDELPK